jgi:hypothetical protein
VFVTGRQHRCCADLQIYRAEGKGQEPEVAEAQGDPNHSNCTTSPSLVATIYYPGNVAPLTTVDFCCQWWLRKAQNHRVPVHAAPIPSRQKVFITIGHQTTMARTLFFGVPEDAHDACTQAALGRAMFAHVGKFASEAHAFDLEREYVFQAELYGIAGAPPLC